MYVCVRAQIKCHRYYPRRKEQEVTFNCFRLVLLSKEHALLQQAPGLHNLIKRTFLLENHLVQTTTCITHTLSLCSLCAHFCICLLKCVWFV
jgi:hypothetical protein